MSNLLDTKVMSFKWDGEVYFHPDKNELEYKFRGFGQVKRTHMFIKINPDTREIEYIQTYAPAICGNTVQYPINLNYENIMKDYDKMIEIFNRDDK